MIRLKLTPPSKPFRIPAKPDGTPINWKRLLRRSARPVIGMTLSLAGLLGCVYGLWLYVTTFGF